MHGGYDPYIYHTDSDSTSWGDKRFCLNFKMNEETKRPCILSGDTKEIILGRCIPRPTCNLAGVQTKPAWVLASIQRYHRKAPLPVRSGNGAKFGAISSMKSQWDHRWNHRWYHCDFVDESVAKSSMNTLRFHRRIRSEIIDECTAF